MCTQNKLEDTFGKGRRHQNVDERGSNKSSVTVTCDCGPPPEWLYNSEWVMTSFTVSLHIVRSLAFDIQSLTLHLRRSTPKLTSF